MITTVDNNSRVFLIKRTGFFSRDFFCNLQEIPKVLTEGFEENDEYKTFEYWNRKFKVCSKKHINEMFKSNNINFKVS